VDACEPLLFGLFHNFVSEEIKHRAFDALAYVPSAEGQGRTLVHLLSST